MKRFCPPIPTELSMMLFFMIVAVSFQVYFIAREGLVLPPGMPTPLHSLKPILFCKGLKTTKPFSFSVAIIVFL